MYENATEIKHPDNFYHIPISLLHVPNMIFSSRRNMWRPGKPFAQPLPVKSRRTDAWLYGWYSYDCVPFPALNPICESNWSYCYSINGYKNKKHTYAGTPPSPPVVSPRVKSQLLVRNIRRNI